MGEIYSIELDRVIEADGPGTLYGALHGNVFELFEKGEGEEDKDIILAGYIRVSHPDLDGYETRWAELWEINESRRLAGLEPVSQEEIAE